MLGAAGIRGDKRQVDLRLHDVGELDLGLFRRLSQPLQGLSDPGLSQSPDLS